MSTPIMIAETISNPNWASPKGTFTFIPQALATKVSGSRRTEKIVRTRRTSLVRWPMTYSLVDSIDSTCSL